MGWNGEQSYYMSVTSEQAVALVLMAKAFWGKRRGGEDGCESRSFFGTYRTFDPRWYDEILRGPSPYEPLAPHPINLMVGDDANSIQELVEVAPHALPVQSLAGIVFPYAYGGLSRFTSTRTKRLSQERRLSPLRPPA